MFWSQDSKLGFWNFVILEFGILFGLEPLGGTRNLEFLLKIQCPILYNPKIRDVFRHF